ncbi:MAG: glycosyltransferase family 87 protein [Caldilineaceae bacterium]
MQLFQGPPPSNVVDGGGKQALGTGARLRNLALEYVAPLAAAIALTLVLTWPLPTYFTHALIGEGDATWGLGTLAYWREAFIGHEPFYYASRLYYPHGVTMVTNSLGPFSALFALPFWGLGPAAAYNATIVLGFALTGFCMYLLVRVIGCSRPAAWVGGLLYMLAPLHLLAVYGHANKVFLGFIPLALLVTYQAMQRHSSRTWPVVVGPVLVLAFLQAPEQFVIAGLGCGLLVLYYLASAENSDLRNTASRLLVMALSAGAGAAVLFLLVDRAAQQTGVIAQVGAESTRYQPDLLQFFVPSGFSVFPPGRYLNALFMPTVNSEIETAVYLTWTAVALAVLAFWKARRQAAAWLLILGVSMLLALGPTLRVMGDSWLTQLEIPLPYRGLNTLPGFDLMRTPGRFMLLGAAGLAAAAAIGLDQVRRMMKPRYAAAFAVLVTGLLVLETWVDRFPSQPLLPVPPFYQKLAQDKEMYGVLDLPIRPEQDVNFSNWHVYFSSFYQVDQITHGKGIASGYVSRQYPIHPVFGQFITENFNEISPLQQDVTVDGQPSSRYANLRYDLAEDNYRYVVLHKSSADNPLYKPGAWGEKAAQRLIDDVFGDERPFVDDELTTVYAVGPLPDVNAIQPSIALLEPAAKMEYGEHRWTRSPAQFLMHSPRPLLTHLEVTLGGIQGENQYADLSVRSGDGNVVATRPIAPLQPTRIPLALAPGSQVITLTLSPTDNAAGEKLAFVIGQADMATAPDTESAITISAGVQEGTQAAYGEGWYPREPDDAAKGDTDNTRRTAASPATIWVYTPQTQALTLRGTPTALHELASPAGQDSSGSLAVQLNGRRLGEWPATVGTPLAIPLAFQPGWSQIGLELIVVQPATGDRRLPSFALQNLEIGPQ